MSISRPAVKRPWPPLVDRRLRTGPEAVAGTTPVTRLRLPCDGGAASRADRDADRPVVGDRAQALRRRRRPTDRDTARPDGRARRRRPSHEHVALRPDSQLRVRATTVWIGDLHGGRDSDRPGEGVTGPPDGQIQRRPPRRSAPRGRHRRVPALIGRQRRAESPTPVRPRNRQHAALRQRSADAARPQPTRECSAMPRRPHAMTPSLP